MDYTSETDITDLLCGEGFVVLIYNQTKDTLAVGKKSLGDLTEGVYDRTRAEANVERGDRYFQFSGICSPLKNGWLRSHFPHAIDRTISDAVLNRRYDSYAEVHKGYVAEGTIITWNGGSVDISSHLKKLVEGNNAAS